VLADLHPALSQKARRMSPGSAKGSKEHSGCVQKQPSGRRCRLQQLTTRPSCVKNAWPTPFTSLDLSVASHAQLEAEFNEK
jgi:hypothetical protein